MGKIGLLKGQRGNKEQTVDKQAAEIERLKAELKAHQGTCVRLNWEQWDLKDERDTLRARVEELEAARDLITQQSNKAMRERDELREKLTAEQKDTDYWMARALTADEQLEALKPKPVVKTRSIIIQTPLGSGEILGTFTDGKLTGAEVVK